MISIIIPTYNEEAIIGELISYLKKHAGTMNVEIIVADGGSNDNTLEVAVQAGAKIITSNTGRAIQMNTGASGAIGDILYFIHADTFPPKGFANDIENAIAEGYTFGRYRTKFNSNKPILKVNAFFTRFDWFVCYGGDQTLFMQRKLFDKINGYRTDMLIMEDYDIVRRAKAFGRYKIFNRPALVSARKYEHNSWLKVQLANKKVVDMYKKGATQLEMVSTYKQLLNYR